jgi:uncharacterized protein YqcC (DUF446 family)
MLDLTASPDLIESVKRIIDEIEAEMKRTGFWSAEPLPDEAYQFHQAFAADTMAFPQWLQFIFIPNVRRVLEAKGMLSSQSTVGIRAIREFDGYEDNDVLQLVRLLNEFDKLCNKPWVG